MQEKKNQEKTEKSRFEELLCHHVLDILGEGFETEVSVTRKNNDVMKKVMYVRKENSECIPCFYLDELYHSYCMGESEWSLAESLANIVRGECEKVRQKAKKYVRKEWIADHLFVRLINRERNKVFLEDAVYRNVLDLAAVFYVLTEDGEEGIKSYCLPVNVWEQLNLGTVEEYFPKVLENTQRLFPEQMYCLTEGMQELLEQGEPGDVIKLRTLEEKELLRDKTLYVLSNRRKICGAATVLYPDILKQIGEQFLGDYYIVPSSIHEVLLLKATEEEEEVRLNEIVHEVNESHVEPEEVLSNHVYYYAREEACLKERRA